MALLTVTFDFKYDYNWKKSWKSLKFTAKFVLIALKKILVIFMSLVPLSFTLVDSLPYRSDLSFNGTNFNRKAHQNWWGGVHNVKEHFLLGLGFPSLFIHLSPTKLAYLSLNKIQPKPASASAVSALGSNSLSRSLHKFCWMFDFCR